MSKASLLKSIGKSLYKGAMTKTGSAAIVAGAAGLGFSRVTAPAARDAALDVAFGDPNADETFLGRKLTPTVFMDTMAPGDNSGSQAIGAVALGAGIGGLIGKSKLGIGIGAAAGAVAFAGLTSAYIGRNDKYLSSSPYVGNRRLNRDMSYGGGLYSKRNKSLETADELNADGNIVLGMHNLRRGG